MKYTPETGFLRLFIARNRFYSRNPVSLYLTYLESAVNPYQGLKRDRQTPNFNSIAIVTINLNPYQGLKLGGLNL